MLLATPKARRNAIRIYMLTKIGKIAEKLNVSLAFWENGLMNISSEKPLVKDDVFPKSVDVYGFAWQTVWQWFGGDRAFNLANGGYKVCKREFNF